MATPHDAYFKAVFGQAQHAAGLAQAFLPAPLLRQIDLSTMEPVPGSFVDERLRQRHCDLLWRVRSADGALVLALLLEHQRTVDPRMPLRMLEYVLRAWRRGLARGEGQPLTPVVPVLLHQGPKPWTGARSLSELYGQWSDEALKPWTPELTPLIVDLAELEDGDLGGTALGQLALTLMKHIDSPDILAEIRGLAGLFRATRKESGLSALEVSVRYVLERNVAVDDLLDVLTIDEPGALEVVMTAGGRMEEIGRQKGLEQGRQEGMQQGMQQGLRQGLQRALHRMLQLRFGALPEDVVRQLAAADVPMLERWTDHVLTATSLAELLGDPPTQSD